MRLGPLTIEQTKYVRAQTDNWRAVVDQRDEMRNGLRGIAEFARRQKDGDGRWALRQVRAMALTVLGE